MWELCVWSIIFSYDIMDVEEIIWEYGSDMQYFGVSSEDIIKLFRSVRPCEKTTKKWQKFLIWDESEYATLHGDASTL